MVKLAVTYEAIQELLQANRDKHPSDYALLLQSSYLSIREEVWDAINDPLNLTHFTIEHTHRLQPNYIVVDLNDHPAFLGYKVVVDKSVTRPTLIKLEKE